MLPAPVMQKIKMELEDWQGSGMSVMEISHRSQDFLEIVEQSEQLLRRLLHIPDNYHILFSHGGASMQFAAVPLNLSSQTQYADYIITGQWGQKAFQEAAKFSKTRIISDTMATLSLPEPSQLHFNEDAAYVHYTDNETILGLEFPYVPNTGEIPLVVDASSNILSRPMDVKKFGVIYACCQKNLGLSGFAVTIVREDLLGRQQPHTPSLLDWEHLHQTNSLSNTAATFPWYVLVCCLQWIEENGGVTQMEKNNIKKAQLLYDYIDASDFYHNPIKRKYRSLMNVPFRLSNTELESQFVEQSTQVGLTNLKGHASVGGIRASIYNSMPYEGVQALITFMQDFKQQS